MTVAGTRASLAEPLRSQPARQLSQPGSRSVTCGIVTTPRSVQRTYFLLLFGNTLAASLIWGINTIFLLDAGLSNFEAFAANAFFTAGMVLFEVPTGIVADTAGRRLSYLLGTVTLSVSTLLYVGLWQIEAPFWAWALVSILIGLGFTFFSGVNPRSCMSRNAATNITTRIAPRSTKGTARLVCAAMNPPATEPPSIALPETI